MSVAPRQEIQQISSNLAANRRTKIQMSPMNQSIQAPAQAVAPVPQATMPSMRVPMSAPQAPMSAPQTPPSSSGAPPVPLAPKTPKPAAGSTPSPAPQMPGAKLAGIDIHTKKAFIQALAALPLLPMAGRGLLAAGRWALPKLLGASTGAKAVAGAGRGLRQARLAMHNMPGGRQLTRMGRSAMEFASNPWTQAAAFAPAAYSMGQMALGGEPTPAHGGVPGVMQPGVYPGPFGPGTQPPAGGMVHSASDEDTYPGFGGMAHSSSAEDIDPGNRLVKLSHQRDEHFS